MDIVNLDGIWKLAVFNDTRVTKEGEHIAEAKGKKHQWKPDKQPEYDCVTDSDLLYSTKQVWTENTQQHTNADCDE